MPPAMLAATRIWIAETWMDATITDTASAATELARKHVDFRSNRDRAPSPDTCRFVWVRLSDCAIRCPLTTVSTGSARSAEASNPMLNTVLAAGPTTGLSARGALRRLDGMVVQAECRAGRNLDEPEDEHDQERTGHRVDFGLTDRVVRTARGRPVSFPTRRRSSSALCRAARTRHPCKRWSSANSDQRPSQHRAPVRVCRKAEIT
jgi:hypothetical protein